MIADPKDQERMNLRVGVAEGLLATPWVVLSLPAGFIVSALLNVHYGVSPGMYGFIASLPAWSNALQVLLVPVLGKLMTARDMTIAMSWLNLGLWAMMAFSLSILPPMEAETAGRVFIVFFLLTSLSGSLIGVGWTSWVQEWVPASVRGDYFGRRNRLVSVVALVFLIVCTLAFRVREGSVVSYQFLFILAVLMRFASVLWQHRIVAVGPARPMVHSGWIQELGALRDHPEFVKMVIFGAWLAFWMNLRGPFIPVYCFDILEISPSRFALLNILATLTGAFALPLWGKAIDKHGCVPVMILSLLLWQPNDFIWALLTPATSWVTYPMWLWGGLSSSGFFLAQFALVLKLIPDRERAAGISANLALSSVTAAVGPILAGTLLGSAAALGFSQDAVYRIGFVVSPCAILLSLFYLRAIREPSGPGCRSVLGTMRTMRQMFQGQGLTFLANVTLQGQRPPEDEEEDRRDLS